MQTQPARDESIVAPAGPLHHERPLRHRSGDRRRPGVPVSKDCKSDEERAAALFELILQREPNLAETTRTAQFAERQESHFKDSKTRIDTPWPIAAQALYMSNEFQYVD